MEADTVAAFKRRDAGSTGEADWIGLHRDARALLVARRLHMPSFAAVIGVAHGVVGILTGLALGVDTGLVEQAILISVALSASAGVVGLAIVWLLFRLIPVSAYSPASPARSLAASYCPVFFGAAIGSAVSSALRHLPVMQFDAHVPRLWQDSVLIISAALAWVFLAMLANRLTDRQERATLYRNHLTGQIAEVSRSRLRIVLAQERVKQAVAEQLHGPIQTQLWLLSERLREASDLIGVSPGEVRTVLAQAGDKLAALVENELTRVSSELCPSVVGEGLSAALRSVCAEAAGVLNTNLKIGNEVIDMESPGGRGLSHDVRLAVYKFVHEAVSNVIRHSKAQTVEIRVWKQGGDAIRVVVSDDGAGFDVRNLRPGLGTTTVRDYISALGGDYEVWSHPGKGTQAHAQIPISSEPSPEPTEAVSTSLA